MHLGKYLVSLSPALVYTTSYHVWRCKRLKKKFGLVKIYV